MRNFLKYAVILLLSFNNASATPAAVFIIRHAEKPKHGNYLTIRGQERAVALGPMLIGKYHLTAENLGAIFAATPTTASVRPYKTCLPTGNTLGVSVNTQFPEPKIKALAKEILNNPAYNNRIVLVCWDHYHIPKLAHALGINPEPYHWPGHVFDRLWIIQYNHDGAVVSFKNFPQRLLFGDSLR
jgi:hypothetical protein